MFCLRAEQITGMNVLLTGGAGYIGSHTCAELLESDPSCNVVIADDFSNSSPKIIERLRTLTGRDIKIYGIDVTDAGALDKLFAKEAIDAVIHFAGYKAVGESCEIPVDYYRNNLDSTLTLLEIMEKHGTKKIIFSSSATVYGVNTERKYVEGMPTGCVNPYGWTKYMSERILTDAASADKELSAVILRYFNPVGAHESGLIGEDPSGVPNNLMPYITQVAVRKLEKLRVFGNDYDTQDGTGVRDYIHVVDLAKGHVAALKYAASHKGAEIFNLGSGCGHSVLEIVKTFEKVNGVEIPYEIVGRRDGDLPEYYADPSKANELLGWKTEKSLEDMCRDSWKWQSGNPDGYK